MLSLVLSLLQLVYCTLLHAVHVVGNETVSLPPQYPKLSESVLPAGRSLPPSVGLLSDHRCFTAAVFERATVPLRQAEIIPMKSRIDVAFSQYSRATKFASKRGADIIVFPEYGIMSSQHREEIAPFIDDLIDPTRDSMIPCDDPDSFVDDSIIVRTSCLARLYHIYIVLNTIDRKPCDIDTDSKCPVGREYRYNTNVVFDRSGFYVARYHKAHPFLEYMVDAAPRQESIFVDTDFGRIGTFVCFDLMFKESIDMIRNHGIDTIAFTTWWKEELPFLASIQMQQGWAVGNDINLIAANTHSPDQAAIGSGIYAGINGAVAFTHVIDGNHRLLFGRLPKKRRDNRIGLCAQSIHMDDTSVDPFANDPIIPSTYVYGSADLTEYKFSKLVDDRGQLRQCHNGLCCDIDYEFDYRLKADHFYLAVRNGTKNAMGIHGWCEEVCSVLRCEDAADAARPCGGTFTPVSNSTFKHFRLKGDFSTNYVYPNLLAPGVQLHPKIDYDFLVDTSETDSSTDPLYVSTLSTHRIKGPIVVGVLYGRCYQRDPPYVRRLKPV